MFHKTPKYLEVAEQIRQEIKNGTFVLGKRISGEHDLSKKYNVSRHTIRAAISVLEKDGDVIRKKGSGTYASSGSYATRKNIGVLLAFADDYIFHETMSGIEQVLAAGNHLFTFALTHNRIHVERGQLLSMLTAKVDGLIVEATKSALASPNFEFYREFASRAIPVIFVNTYYPSLECNYIVNDDIEGARKATRYLISQGHRKIGGIFKYDASQGDLRYEGFVNTLYEQDLILDDNLIIWYSDHNCDPVKLFSDEQLPMLAEKLAGCTAILCYNDKIANELLKASKKMKIRIPEDLSLVSFDNVRLATETEPQITTIDHPSREIGKLAAESVLELIENPNHTVRHLFAPQLVIRDSVRNIL
ncbi:MAG: GntR family transcriptional regulator [Oscillospiraceae bacterium]|nr:GntR family transcriptional regulator [Oscillospiraceae bacterium]MCL2278533.1 GntR family transcriptional regulator [Oscillospiraceae bacterium]